MVHYIYTVYGNVVGVLIVTERELSEDGSCKWKTIRQMDIPSSAYFQDYSGINIDADGRVLITSQVCVVRT